MDSASLILSVAKAVSHVGRRIAPLAITILGLTRKVRSKYHDTATNAFCDCQWPLTTEEPRLLGHLNSAYIMMHIHMYLPSIKSLPEWKAMR